MSTVGTSQYTINDWRTSMDPDGRPARLINLLSQRNEILKDMVITEGNLPTGHVYTQVTGLPAAYFRLLNLGVPESKASEVQVTDSRGMMEAWCKVDQALAELNGNTAEFRMKKQGLYFEAMNQAMATNLFYGNEKASPEAFTGLAPRYSSLSAGNADNIIDAGGTGSDNTSIWYVNWHEETCHAFFPKGQADRAGLNHEDLGLETVYDANNNPYRAYRDHYMWYMGLALPDWRHVVRIANIDVSNLIALSSNADLINLMIRAQGKVPFEIGRPAFYANKTVWTMLKILSLNKSSNVALVQTAANQFEMQFFGTPVRRCDALLNSEARVV